MMLGASSSSLIGTNSATGEAGGSGGNGEVGGGGAGGAIPGGGFSDEDKAAARIEGGGGNRWPRQETLALLQIRSEMGVIFRDSNLKVPLWEEVSRKMAQLGYQRSGKKCKEKFENVYKYHKRTKDSRAAKADGKSYRFFEQLEALESSPSAPILSLPPPPPPAISTNTTIIPPTTPATVALRGTPIISPPPFFSNVNVTSSAATHIPAPSVNNNPMWSAVLPPSHESHQPLSHLQHSTNTTSQGIGNTLASSSQLMSDSLSSSSTSSDHHHVERRQHHRKRKMRDFFDRLMKDVIDKQEELQKKLLETLEKRERDRMIREEAWKVQEMARLNRELDLLAHERSKAATKDATMMTFLRKMAGQQSPQTPTNNINVAPPQVQVSLPQVSQQHSQPPPQPLLQAVSNMATITPLPPLAPSLSTPTLPTSAYVLAAVPRKSIDTLPAATATAHALAVALVPARNDIAGANYMTPPSSSRWPKAEVEALISLRKNIDVKYLDNNPKGPLWEEISRGMSKLGYNRSSKRCKEKWENINKYFKKVKESNKKRPEDSKTCPYFHKLDAIYREKAKADPSSYSTATYMITEKPMSENEIVPLMVRPEQQWPLHQQESTEDNESDNMIDEDEEDDEDDDDGEGYEIVTNKQAASSMPVATSAAE